MKRIPSIIVFFLLTLSACAGVPTATSEPAPTLVPSATALLKPASATLTARPSVTVTSRPAGPTKTPVPTQMVIPFPSSTETMQENGSPTPSVPTVFSADGTPAQCYLGPGTEYQPSFTFKTAQIVGKDATNLWWYLELYDKLGKPFFCWVNAKKISTAGDLSNIAITESETASVTAVNISFDGGDTQTVICNPRADQPEFRFSGEIVTNGPVKNLRYQWETTSGEKSPPEQIQVLAWDDPARFKINLSVPAQEGSYSLTLRTIYPNEVVRVVQFVVKCQ